MTKKELSTRYRDLDVTCGINQRYHQLLQWRFTWLDRIMKIAVGFLAALGFWFAIADRAPWGFIVGLVSLFAALALNVIQFGEWDKDHLDLFRQWSALRRDAELEWNKLGALDDGNDASKSFLERLADITNREHELHTSEPCPWRQLLRKCQEDENESRLGKGMRTPEDIAKERQRRMSLIYRPQSAAVEGTAQASQVEVAQPGK